MALQCGIVGLPNVGKSTIFNALTSAGAQIANYPFCTIEPNVGVVTVQDPRLEAISNIVQPAKIIPTVMEFLDIAGLVKGASKGEGLGNQFLGNIRQVDAVAHVVRCFENDDVTHVHGTIDPASDIEVIDTELMLADLASVEKRRDTVIRKARSGDKEARFLTAVYDKVILGLNEGKPIRALGLSPEEKVAMRDLFPLTAKPVLYVCNVDDQSAAAAQIPGQHPLTDAVRARAAREGAEVVAICGAMEAEIAQLEAEEKQAFLDDLGLKEPGLDRLIRHAYRLLGLMTFFTAGPKEVRAWTVVSGAKAPNAAGVIHTDFERGFIRAEVISYDDFVACGGESGAKEKGKLRVEGKEYTVADGDVMHFRFNV
ncbi:MAG: redox-regulated ATPase YchF [Magnetococcales bacterium]|nr:redox-regulated ATPase YchF [Magnetococcales bacterium]MBF0150040.1 redox-regulated ATPase YchF [Magnetococcales bacterium]MBF0173504.1 redox-regulated ATPase YchF [Magnetococcales bacterium]MBF0629517.1 redox-regulated ATPase YchF [Magnetococcales bacterium]